MGKETNRGTIQSYGGCIYCGQSQMIEHLEEASQEQIDKWATEKCNCDGAKGERFRRESKAQAMQNIKILFGDEDDDEGAAASIFNAAIDAIAAEKVESVTINLGLGVKGVLQLGNNGRVKIKKTTMMVDELEN